MKVGDKVRIRTGKRGNPPRGEVVEFVLTPVKDSPVIDGNLLHQITAARVSRKGIGIEVYPIDCLTVVFPCIVCGAETSSSTGACSGCQHDNGYPA